MTLREVGGRFDPAENAEILLRYQDVELWMFRLLATWLPRLREWQLKIELGKHIWAESQHVDALWARRRELADGTETPPTPNRRLSEVFAEVERGDCVACFLTSLYGVIKPGLLRCYERHIELTDHVADAPTVHALRTIAHAEREHIDWGARALARLERPGFCGREEAAARSVADMFDSEIGEFPGLLDARRRS